MHNLPEMAGILRDRYNYATKQNLKAFVILNKQNMLYFKTSVSEVENTRTQCGN